MGKTGTVTEKTMTKADCARNCAISQQIECDLQGRPPAEEIRLDELYPVEDKKLLGYFADDTFYDRLITEDCDVYLKGQKVLTFRKALFPLLKDKDPEAQAYFTWAAKDLYSDSRGLVAGKEMVTDLDVRSTTGILNAMKAASDGTVETVEEMEAIVNRSPDMSKNHFRVGNIKTDFPKIADSLVEIEEALRKKKCAMVEREEIKKRRGDILREWFPIWLNGVWANSSDKAGEAKRGMDRYISKQIRSNRCYSNILGAMDRSARVPYCRISGTTQKKPELFEKYKPVYQAACSALRMSIPDRWESLYSRFSNVADPTYNLFGTCFTTLTMNWNFRTAFHRDANNCEGGIAVLTAMTKGEYEGHYLVFPEIRLAFDLRDGDFLAGDNQGLIHGNTAMIPKSPDAERVSFVFYSRERMVLMEDPECETCRRNFLVYAKEQYNKTHGTGHKGWNGIWEGMWHSPEWISYKDEQGLERCGTCNWWGTEA